MLGLAPYALWPMTVLSPAALFALLTSSHWRVGGFLTGWLFGIGLFGAGASWVYVSINVYGQASPALAGALTAVFCLGLAVLSGLQTALFCRLKSDRWTDSLLLFPALWVVLEWTRSWLLTGFPWLYAGYGGVDSFAKGWAPVVGVYGMSFILVAAGSTLTLAARNTRRGAPRYWLLPGGVAMLAALGQPLQLVNWTTPVGQPLTAAIYQPNIPLEQKWDRRYFREILQRYQGVTRAELASNDLVLLPESALPAYRDAISDYLEDWHVAALAENTALITGIPTRDAAGRYNSIVGLGTGSGEHHKQKLVPFGEYVPLEFWLRGAIAFFDLPMSQFQAGPPRAPRIQAGHNTVATFICYEIVYPDFVAAGAQESSYLVTVSNDSWFGHSIGPLQHLEMARFRALETGRPLLRGTNNGVSAIIDHRGEVRVSSAQFLEEVIRGEIQPRTGTTPFMRLGSAPIVALCLMVIVAAGIQRRRN